MGWELQKARFGVPDAAWYASWKPLDCFHNCLERAREIAIQLSVSQLILKSKQDALKFGIEAERMIMTKK